MKKYLLLIGIIIFLPKLTLAFYPVEQQLEENTTFDCATEGCGQTVSGLPGIPLQAVDIRIKYNTEQDFDSSCVSTSDENNGFYLVAVNTGAGAFNTKSDWHPMIPLSDSVFETVEFTWNARPIDDMSEIDQFVLAGNWFDSGCIPSGTGVFDISGSDDDPYDGGWTNSDFPDHDWYFEVFGTGLDGSRVQWGNNLNVEPMVTNDFERWPLCVSFTGVPTTEKFYTNFLIVGNELDDTPIDVTEDNSEPHQLWLSVTHNSSGETYYSSCYSFPKSTDLNAGNYIITAFLYNQDGDVLGDTGSKHLTITSGDQIEFPTSQVIAGTEPQCNDSNVIGNAFCRVMVYLFIPAGGFSSFWATEASDFNDSLYAQAPFAYFEPVKDTIEGLDTSPSSPEINLHIPSPLTEDGFDIDFFNPDNDLFAVYIDHKDTLFLWIEVGLWLSFATYLLFRVFKFFKPV